MPKIESLRYHLILHSCAKFERSVKALAWSETYIQTYIHTYKHTYKHTYIHTNGKTTNIASAI